MSKALEIEVKPNEQAVYVLQVRLYIEGVEYPLQSCNITYAENQPVTALLTIPAAKEVLEFVSLFETRPRIVITAQLLGDLSESQRPLSNEHILFDGITTAYSYQVSNNGIILQVQAIDVYSAILNDTTFVDISPASVFEVTKQLTSNVQAGALNTLIELISQLIVSGFHATYSNLTSLAGIITTEPIPLSSRTFVASGTPFSEEHRKYLENLQEALTEDGVLTDLALFGARGRLSEMPMQPGGQVSERAKQLYQIWKEDWEPLVDILLRRNGTYVQQLKAAIQQDRGCSESEAEKYTKALLFSIWAQEGFHWPKDTISPNYAGALGPYQVTYSTWPEARPSDVLRFSDGYEQWLMSQSIQLRDTRGRYPSKSTVGELTKNAIAGKSPAERLRYLEGTCPLTALDMGAHVLLIKRKRVGKGKGWEYWIAATAAYNGGEGGPFASNFKKSGYDLLEALKRGVNDPSGFRPDAYIENYSYVLATWGRGGWGEFYLNDGQPKPDWSNLSSQFIWPEKTIVFKKEEKQREITCEGYLTADPQVLKEDSAWSPAPFWGQLRNEVLTTALVPCDVGKWLSKYTLVSDLLTSQIGAMDIFKRDANLWYLLQIFLSQTHYELVPTIPALYSGGENKTAIYWMAVPQMALPPTDERYYPKYNRFMGTQLVDSHSVFTAPTMIFGFLNPGFIGPNVSALRAVYPKNAKSNKYLAMIWETDIDDSNTIDLSKVKDDKFDQALKNSFTVEELWRGPVRVFKEYSALELGIQQVEKYKGEYGELQDLLQEYVTRDFLIASFQPITISVTTIYEPRVRIGLPAYVSVYGVGMRGIVNSVSLFFSPSGFNQVVTLRSVYTEFTDLPALIKFKTGENEVKLDPWMVDQDANNLEIAAKLDEEKLRPLTLSDRAKLGYFVRKELMESILAYARFMHNIAFLAIPSDLGEIQIPWLKAEKPTWQKLTEFTKISAGRGETVS